MLRFIIPIRLHAWICTNCRQPLSGLEVRLYRATDEAAPAPTAGDELSAKLSFHELDEEEIRRRDEAGLQLAEGTTDANGAVTFDLDTAQSDYDGEGVEAVIYLDRIPGADGRGQGEPLYLATGAFQPAFRDQEEERHVAEVLPYIIPARYWCALLRRFRLWVICGRVVSQQDGAGLDALTVRAFDRDWLQDDPLGEAVTNAGGYFRIFYTQADFRKTPFSPFINIELASGPDLFFHVLTAGGNMLLEEDPSQGRAAGRENVGTCACVTLRIAEGGPGVRPDAPYFTHVGYFNITTDIHLSGPHVGKTSVNRGSLGGAQFGFFGSPLLRGFVPERRPGTSDQLYYRFLYVEPVTSEERPITADMLVTQLVGSRRISWDLDSDGVFSDVFQDIYVAPSGATTLVAPGGSGALPGHVIVPDAQGWVRMIDGVVGQGFQMLLRFDSARIVPGGAAPGSGAGQPVAVPKNGGLTTLIFETTTDPSDSTRTVRQTQTVPLFLNNWDEVRELALQQHLMGAAGGCTGLTTQVTILYSVDHQLLAATYPRLGVSSAASSNGSGWTAPALPTVAPPPANVSPRGVHHSNTVNIAAWPPCSYRISLTTLLARTTGESADQARHSDVIFCKS